MDLNLRTKENIVLTKGLTILFAIAGGILVTNLYYNQPLLSEVARTFFALVAIIFSE